ncbi:cupin domain-containing protein [Pontibacter harenae]|uniref:cupin domain-containing protein n=1 Tax=Pontibacter harenae TaxID=2894083 RepID=UPI001E35132C|nr:cupin domain-containing protein [Pontibacter harenae]MCC9169043.1 cupin domain-containing protein [Pontibacter harenae]
MSNPKYIKQTKPFRVPTTDGKLIEEHFGNASTHTSAFSVAHMVAPPQWSEPHQTPEFDEITIVTRGKKLIEIDGEEVEVKAGETILIKAGTRIRYANPYDEETEYWSVCIPAFDFTKVNREEA